MLIQLLPLLHFSYYLSVVTLKMQGHTLLFGERVAAVILDVEIWATAVFL